MSEKNVYIYIHVEELVVQEQLIVFHRDTVFNLRRIRKLWTLVHSRTNRKISKLEAMKSLANVWQRVLETGVFIEFSAVGCMRPMIKRKHPLM